MMLAPQRQKSKRGESCVNRRWWPSKSQKQRILRRFAQVYSINSDATEKRGTSIDPKTTRGGAGGCIVVYSFAHRLFGSITGGSLRWASPLYQMR